MAETFLMCATDRRAFLKAESMFSFERGSLMPAQILLKANFRIRLKVRSFCFILLCHKTVDIWIRTKTSILVLQFDFSV